MPSPSAYDDMTDKEAKGTLYIVATPIGNLEDITLRALSVLKSVDVIAAEDTRHTGKLLRHYAITNPLFSFHDHNERDRIETLLGSLKKGKQVALVSDAGTPSVSDPGFRLVREAIREGLNVVPIPGVSAAVSALCASGLPTDAFSFYGFPPRKKGKRKEFLSQLRHEKNTLIFYESPHRILPLIEDMVEIFGDREAVLAREMTKLHEEFVRGTLKDIYNELSIRVQIRGECTLIVSEAPDEVLNVENLEQEILERLNHDDISPSSLAKDLSSKYSIKKRDIYEKILMLRDSRSD